MILNGYLIESEFLKITDLDYFIKKVLQLYGFRDSYQKKTIKENIKDIKWALDLWYNKEKQFNSWFKSITQGEKYKKICNGLFLECNEYCKSAPCIIKIETPRDLGNFFEFILDEHEKSEIKRINFMTNWELYAKDLEKWNSEHMKLTCIYCTGFKKENCDCKKEKFNKDLLPKKKYY